MSAFASLFLALVKRFATAIAIDSLAMAARQLGYHRAAHVRRKPEATRNSGANFSTGSQHRASDTTDEGA